MARIMLLPSRCCQAAMPVVCMLNEPMLLTTKSEAISLW